MGIQLKLTALSRKNQRLLWSGFLLLCLSVSSPYAYAQFAGGTGSADDPYLVATAQQLNQVRHHLSSHFKQTQDISLHASNWLPIGGNTADEHFTGVYDGDGFSISGMTVLQGTVNYQGLFAYLRTAVVRDVHLVDVSVTGQSYSGALAGYATQSQIEQVTVQGSVTGHNYVGGLLGWLHTSSLFYTQADVSVNGTDSVGGLAGVNQTSSAYYLSAQGSVSGSSNNIGGLFGQLQGGVTTDSYTLASVNGVNYVGGLAGSTYGGSTQLHRSFSAGLVNGSGDQTGGLIGARGAFYGIATVVDSFWDLEASDQLGSDGGVGLTSAAMQQASSYPNFNFRTAWQDPAISGGYPKLQNLSQYTPLNFVDLSELAGEGTAESPYRVTNTAELNAMRQDLNAVYQLANDIDLVDSVIWNQGKGWEPVGTSADHFAGELDGNGFQLLNLTVNRPDLALQGLFGRTSSGAVIRNVTMVDLSVQGGSDTGGLVGYADATEVANVQVTGEVTGRNQVGGLAGRLSGGSSVFYCASSSVSIKGNDSLGGLAGVTQSARVYYSSSAGRVMGEQHVGGLFGQMQGGVTSDTFSHAVVTGNNYVGGLTGSTYGGSSEVYRSFSSGKVTGSGDHTGGLIGQRIAFYGLGIVEDSYWDVQSSSQPESSAGEGRSTAQMQQASNYMHFNFFNAWVMPAHGPGYPVFQDLAQYDQPQALMLSDLQGNGSLHSPYLIHNPSELNAMRQDLGAHYRLVNDIDLRETVAWNQGQGWEPVGVGNERFTGSLDGKHRRLSDLTINRPDMNDQGLFGVTDDGARIQDLKLERVNIQGSNDTGALAGKANTASVIENIQAAGEVTGKNQTGGLIGALSGANSLIQYGAANMSVKGNNNVGGLIGLTQSVRVETSYSTGSVRGGNYIGGLIGQQQRGLTANVFSLASVTGADYVGGLAGSIYAGSAEINRAYSAGPVQGSGSPAGGLLGARVAFYGVGSVIDSYWDINTSGQSESGGGEGRSTADMTYPYAANVYEGWDFSNDWRPDIQLHNQGYPYLRGKMLQSAIRRGLPLWIYLQ